ncbi:MAG: DNA/RNA non-specific endonuclease [Verrucomicrobiaceae bacterium]|nr:MAG: DNA/RNA non-specific endonuclease [Verrucomicrobiaceae bacterium]
MPEDFSDRDGYDSLFLGDNFSVPMPGLGDHTADAFEPADALPTDPFSLRYRRFSVILSKSRRFCRVSAVNINGEEPYWQIPRVGWRKDPRAEDYQEDDETLYGPDTFSRGHMVRRQDPLWGDKILAKQANKDTFHLSNSVPQVQTFNAGLWGRLEDHILAEGKSKAGRLSVFTGPVFGDNDPLYVDGRIAVPLLFYKLVVAVSDGDELIAAAFVQSQEDVLPALMAGFDPGPFTPYQVSVADLELLTGLSFGLEGADVFSGPQAAAAPRAVVQGAGGISGIPLKREEQVIFG